MLLSGYDFSKFNFEDTKLHSYTKAIVRIPGRNLVNGLSTANLGPPDYQMALAQHQSYVAALQTCGLEVIILAPDDRYPDSTFVEDTALLTPDCAIITNPGALSRKGEIIEMAPVLQKYYTDLAWIQDPGTVDAGDILRVVDHYYIGISARTNVAGARQVIAILNQYGRTGAMVSIKNLLHLKSGIACLDRSTLVAVAELAGKPEFAGFTIIPVPEEESYAANCLALNGTVLVPEGFPGTQKRIEDAGFSTIAQNMSEFRKLDGGLSCLSLRF